jgi:3,4-dihydroxyphenylacetate 2,3-dioxygenase
MGTIVGAGLLSHVPTLFMSEAERRELNEGEDTSLFAGIHQVRTERLDPLEADTIVVIDTHWFTTVEHVVASHQRRAGLYTSEELPRGVSNLAYDIEGDPELAQAWEAAAVDVDDTWVTAIDDPRLPIHYPTLSVDRFLRTDQRLVTASVCQTADTQDYLLFGRLLAEAIEAVDRRVVVVASGGLSHRFWPLREFRDHEASDPDKHLRTPEAAAADRFAIDRLLHGDHRAVVDFVPEYLPHGPEGRLGHYLTMLGALGGPSCTLAGTQFGNYEAVSGTGQVHIWFDC